ncbi:hypothetical protein JYT15_01020 [Acidimicrobium ferrooxidans]|nr:hypothetical protein [Acidimicrobium ferrooxidans]
MMLWLDVLFQGERGPLLAAVLGLLAGLGARWIVNGLASVARREQPGLVMSVILPLACMISAAAFTPAIHHVAGHRIERELWGKATASQRLADWKEYELQVAGAYRRKGYLEHYLLAKATEAAATENVHLLREALKRGSGLRGKAFDEARKRAFAGVARLYKPALDKLATPRDTADEKLRAAMRTVIADLIRHSDPRVFLRFTTSTALERPKGSEIFVELIRNLPEVKAGFPNQDAPVIPHGEAFAQTSQKARRAAFLNASRAAFAELLSTDMLRLVWLEDASSPMGKLVISVRSRIRRMPAFIRFSPTRNGSTSLAGLMFIIEVEWDFEIRDREGKLLYKAPPSKSHPGKSIQLKHKDDAPDWALYRVMADSASHNYGRQLVVRFGLVPPPERKVFVFSRSS